MMFSNLGLAALLYCTIHIAFAQDTQDKQCPNNELVQMKQPKLAKRPVDYISLRCIIANISSNDLQYYRWYTRDENGATSSICFTSLSDTTDPQSQTCKIDDDSVGFQKEASEYHNMLNNSILTTIGISVELNESYKYICEVTMTNKSRCHLEYGVKYGDPEILLTLDPKLSNEVHESQAIYEVNCSVRAPRGTVVINLDYNGTKKEQFKFKGTRPTTQNNQVVAYMSLPDAGNITCNVTDALGSYYKTMAIQIFEKDYHKSKWKSWITILGPCAAIVLIVFACTWGYRRGWLRNRRCPYNSLHRTDNYMNVGTSPGEMTNGGDQ